MFTPSEDGLAPALLESAEVLASKASETPESMRAELESEKRPSNPYGRMHKPEKAASIIVKEHAEGEITFSLVEMRGKLYRPLVIEEIEEQRESASESEKNISMPTEVPKTPPQSPSFMLGERKFTAHTPNGTKMSSERSFNLCHEGAQAAILLFSPKRKRDGLDEKVHQKRKNCKAKRRLSFGSPFREDDSLNAPSAIKGEGEEFTLHSYKERPARKKVKSQHAVMGKSANDEFVDLMRFIEQNGGERERYGEKLLESLKKLAEDFGLEWLHGLGYGLAPKEFDPQTKENLGAAPKWINTLMMPFESLAAHFVDEGSDYKVSVKPQFMMIPCSNVITKVHYQVTIENAGKKCIVYHSMDALEFPNRSNWPSTTDSPQLIRTVSTILEGEILEEVEFSSKQSKFSKT